MNVCEDQDLAVFGKTNSITTQTIYYLVRISLNIFIRFGFASNPRGIFFRKTRPNEGWFHQMKQFVWNLKKKYPIDEKFPKKNLQEWRFFTTFVLEIRTLPNRLSDSSRNAAPNPLISQSMWARSALKSSLPPHLLQDSGLSVWCCSLPAGWCEHAYIRKDVVKGEFEMKASDSSTNFKVSSIFPFYFPNFCLGYARICLFLW